MGGPACQIRRDLVPARACETTNRDPAAGRPSSRIFGTHRLAVLLSMSDLERLQQPARRGATRVARGRDPSRSRGEGSSQKASILSCSPQDHRVSRGLVVVMREDRPGERTTRTLVVPRTPGPLLDPDEASRGRPPDEIDEAITELFGPDPPTRPGRFDVALVVVGVGLIVWARVALHSDVITVLGAICLFLGSVLPLRSAWRAFRRWRMARRRAAVVGRGLALDVTDPRTRRLADAYAALLVAAKLPGAPLKVEAPSAGLTAVTEVASLLGGGPPSTPAEREYVEKRLAAIERLAETLRRRHEASLRTPVDGQPDDGLERKARAEASAELEKIGISSLYVLDDLVREAEVSPSGS